MNIVFKTAKMIQVFEHILGTVYNLCRQLLLFKCRFIVFPNLDEILFHHQIEKKIH